MPPIWPPATAEPVRLLAAGDALQRDNTAFAQLLGPEGVVGQGDLAQPTTAIVSPGVRGRLSFPALVACPAGSYQLIAGFYYGVDGGWQRLEAAGQDYVSLGSVAVQPADHAGQPAPGARRLRRGLELVGVDFDRGVAGQTRVYLHWRQAAGSEGAAVQATLSSAGDGQVVWQGTVPALAAGQRPLWPRTWPTGWGRCG
jgi:hypothetical protein